MKKKLKVAITYNEANPDFYIKPAEINKKKLSFTPYFEVDNLTPIEEFELLAERLCENDINAYTINIKDDIDFLLTDLKKNKPDVIFNFIELFKDNARLEMNVVGLLELLGIPYTGAPPISLANCQNKVLAKRILNTFGIKTPKFALIKKLAGRYNHGLEYPLIVKPAFEDASVGIDNNSIVENFKQLKARIKYVLDNFLQPALVEEYIEGRELNVAVLGDKNPKSLPISEIDFTAMPDHLYNIVSYQAKWDPQHEAYHKTIPSCPAKLDTKIEKKANEIAVKAFHAMGCRDYARVDMRLNEQNELYVLEVNPNPDLTEAAGFMRSAEAAGMSYENTLKKIINLAWARRNKILK
ncbi:MAG: ATP-grasp domain-containing protein [Bacteroidetes bacterium]|nr:ATP-grasp domain-containing protein [Bacteroidota bacterium]